MPKIKISDEAFAAASSSGATKSAKQRMEHNPDGTWTVDMSYDSLNSLEKLIRRGLVMTLDEAIIFAEKNEKFR